MSEITVRIASCSVFRDISNSCLFDKIGFGDEVFFLSLALDENFLRSRDEMPAQRILGCLRILVEDGVDDLLMLIAGALEAALVLELVLAERSKLQPQGLSGGDQITIVAALEEKAVETGVQLVIG